jgi:hypothetical protein
MLHSRAVTATRVRTVLQLDEDFCGLLRLSQAWCTRMLTLCGGPQRHTRRNEER